MLDKLLTTKTIFIVAGLILLWLFIFWMNDANTDQNTSAEPSRLEQQKDGDMVSSIQPISEVAPGSDSSNTKVNSSVTKDTKQDSSVKVLNIEAQPQQLDAKENAELHKRFGQALLAQQDRRVDDAIAIYQALIVDFPQVPENYINLANLHGSNGDLQSARAILMRGIEANQKASVLMQGLQSVHSALAAKAYRKALDVNVENQTDTAVVLPVVLELQTNLDAQDQLQRLQNSLSEQAQSSEGSKQLAAEYQQQIQSLNKQLDTEKQNALNANEANIEQISSLTQRLTQADETLAATQAAEREALARVVRAEQDAKIQIQQANEEVANLKAELEQKNAALLATQQQQEELQAALSTALNGQQVEPLIADQEVKVDPPIASAAVTISSITELQKQHAIDRVKSWAKSWSDQDVDAYVNQYIDTYSPESAGSRAVWLDQRRVRLTNKKFIRVDVSRFSVDDLGERFAVTFRQHYKSDVIDDVIFKSLEFVKPAGDDWSQAKIVLEKVVKPR